MTKPQKPRLVEVAPGETRQLCLVCDNFVKRESGRLYCDEHSKHKVNSCERCGKGTSGTICKECRAAGDPPSQIRAGKRELTEHDRPLVEKLWAEGWSSTEIAEHLGLSTKSPNQAIPRRRLRGWNLPYRAPWAVERARKMAKKQNAKRRKVSA